MLEKVSGDIVDKKPELIHKNLLQIVEELGDVSSTTREALKDGKVNNREREEVLRSKR